MFQPKRIKHKKVHKGTLKSKTTRGFKVNFGSFGLKAMESSWLTGRQIEAARRAMTRFIQRGGKVWIRVFPDKPRTSKSSEVGMGGGAGAIDHFVAPVEAGRVIFEMDGVTKEIASEAFRLAAHKLPVKTKFVVRE